MARGIRRNKLERDLKIDLDKGAEISKEDSVYVALFPNGPDEELINHILYSDKARKFREYLGLESAGLKL